MEGAQEGAGAAGQGASKLPGNALGALRLLKHKKLSTSKLLVQSRTSSQPAMYLCNARCGLFLFCQVKADIWSLALPVADQFSLSTWFVSLGWWRKQTPPLIVP